MGRHAKWRQAVREGSSRTHRPVGKAKRRHGTTERYHRPCPGALQRFADVDPFASEEDEVVYDSLPADPMLRRRLRLINLRNTLSDTIAPTRREAPSASTYGEAKEHMGGVYLVFS